MPTRLALAVLILPCLALAQPETTPPPTVVVPPPVEPVHPAVPILPSWNLGAGFGFTFSGASLAAPISAGLLGSTGLSSSAIPTAPRMTVLIERRLSERLFLTFQAAVSFSASQSETYSALSSRQVSLEGTVGLRRVFNPGGVIEVSWFGSAGLGYGNSENRTLLPALDPATGMLSPTTPQTARGNSFAVGAVTGLTLERELVSGLALRLSSSILGVSYGQSASHVSTPDTSVDLASHGMDAGLRFSPSLEVRYAF